MPIPSQYSDMVSDMVTATEEGRVNWLEGARASEFFVAFATSTLAVWAGEDRHSMAEFVAFGIRDKNGNMGESFYIEEGSTDFDKLERLYDLARRTARHVDQAVAEINSALRTKGSIGFSVPINPPNPTDNAPI